MERVELLPHQFPLSALTRVGKTRRASSHSAHDLRDRAHQLRIFTVLFVRIIGIVRQKLFPNARIFPSRSKHRIPVQGVVIDILKTIEC